MAQFNLPTIDPAVATGTNLADWLNQWKPAMLGLQSGVAAPSYAIAGTLWLDSTRAGAPNNIYDLKIYNGAQWVTLGNIGTTAPTWSPGGTGNDVGRNKLHNSMFNIAQRGNGPFTVPGYTMDRWNFYNSLDTANVQRQAFTPISLSGDEEPSWYLVNTFTGNAGAAAQSALYQPIENVRRLAGKTVTVSFWAFSGPGALKLGVSIDQFFGTGGSPSGNVSGAGQSVTLTTGWARYSLTFTLPTIVGKTLGTNDNSSTTLTLWYSSGATNAVRAGNIGVQSGYIMLWGVQLEVGTVATPLEKLDPVTQLQQCQRMFYNGFVAWAGYTPAGQLVGAATPFPVTMRTTPTLAFSGTVYSNCASIQMFTINATHCTVCAVGTAAGAANFTSVVTASAEL